MVVAYCSPSQCNGPLGRAKVIQFTFKNAEPAVSVQDEVWNVILRELENHGQGVENGASQNMERGASVSVLDVMVNTISSAPSVFFFKTWLMSARYRCPPPRIVCTAGWQ
jgi:hypothetical protein